MESDTVNRGDSDRAADDFLHFHEFAVKLVVNLKNFFRGLVDALSFPSQLELLLAPVDEKSVEVALHRSRLLTDGRLCHAVKASCFREAFCLYKIGEYFEVIYLHGIIYVMFLCRITNAN